MSVSDLKSCLALEARYVWQRMTAPVRRPSTTAFSRTDTDELRDIVAHWSQLLAQGHVGRFFGGARNMRRWIDAAKAELQRRDA